jgi:hypothetical protein
MEVGMPTDQATSQSRWPALALTVAGIAMIAFPLAGGFRVLQAVGMAKDDYMTMGSITLLLVPSGVLSVILGLILALKAKPAWLIGAGAALLCLGTGPLLVVILLANLGLSADPDPNPVGFGILAAVTLIPALALLIGGFASRANRKTQHA